MRNTFLATDEDYFRIAPPGFGDLLARAQALGFRNAVYQVGDSASDPAATLMLHLPPGGVLFRHRHDCHRFEIIIQGSLQTEDGQWLHPGDIRTSKPGEFYGPHTAGPAGVLALEVFSSTTGLTSEIDPDLPAEHLEILLAARKRVAQAKVARRDPSPSPVGKIFPA